MDRIHDPINCINFMENWVIDKQQHFNFYLKISDLCTMQWLMTGQPRVPQAPSNPTMVSSKPLTLPQQHGVAHCACKIFELFILRNNNVEKKAPWTCMKRNNVNHEKFGRVRWRTQTFCKKL